jgi:hypothetical protein
MNPKNSCVMPLAFNNRQGFGPTSFMCLPQAKPSWKSGADMFFCENVLNIATLWPYSNLKNQSSQYNDIIYSNEHNRSEHLP